MIKLLIIIVSFILPQSNCSIWISELVYIHWLWLHLLRMKLNQPNFPAPTVDGGVPYYWSGFCKYFLPAFKNAKFINNHWIHLWKRVTLLRKIGGALCKPFGTVFVSILFCVTPLRRGLKNQHKIQGFGWKMKVKFRNIDISEKWKQFECWR